MELSEFEQKKKELICKYELLNNFEPSSVTITNLLCEIMTKLKNGEISSGEANKQSNELDKFTKIRNNNLKEFQKELKALDNKKE